MILILFTIAAGVAVWAEAATRLGTVRLEAGRPIALGAGTTVALLLALGAYLDVQDRRMAAAIMSKGGALFDRGLSERRASDRVFEARRDAFDRDFKASRDAFSRSFEKREDAFDRAFKGHEAAVDELRRANTRAVP